MIWQPLFVSYACKLLFVVFGSIIQQALLALQGTNVGHVLRNLNTALVGTLCIVQGKVANMDEFAAHLDPKLRYIALAGMKIVQDDGYPVYALGWVALGYCPPDDGR